MREEPVIRLPLTQSEGEALYGVLSHSQYNDSISACTYCRALNISRLRERLHRHLRAAAKNGAPSPLPHKEALRNV